MRPGYDYRLVERWWNGVWGRLSQKRIWLWTNGEIWRVEARKGDGDADVWGKDFVSELEARLLVREMRERNPRDEWKELPPADPPVK